MRRAKRLQYKVPKDPAASMDARVHCLRARMGLAVARIAFGATVGSQCSFPRGHGLVFRTSFAGRGNSPQAASTGSLRSPQAGPSPPSRPVLRGCRPYPAILGPAWRRPAWYRSSGTCGDGALSVRRWARGKGACARSRVGKGDAGSWGQLAVPRNSRKARLATGIRGCAHAPYGRRAQGQKGVHPASPDVPRLFPRKVALFTLRPRARGGDTGLAPSRARAPAKLSNAACSPRRYVRDA